MTYDPLLDRMPTTQPLGRAARDDARPAYREEASFKIPGGCGLMGVCDESGAALPAELAVRAMAVQRDRGNGLGGGFAGYGIYPELAELFCFHLMFHDTRARDEVEAFLAHGFEVERAEPIPTRPVTGIDDPPLLWRYFLSPHAASLAGGVLSAEEAVVAAVMHVNAAIDGAFVASSGKNMGVFKGVGFPEEIAHFYRLEEYTGHTWLGHSRFPTNTPGWWGGAHPFTLLDWSVVHNGEISSYGINRRYLEQFGYRCTLGTDTEVAAYLFDLLLRRHGLPLELACKVIASPLWGAIDRLGESDEALLRALRCVYGSAMLNGPFAIVLGFDGGMMALNDRIKLRPLVAARRGSIVTVASEESAICEVLEAPDAIWAPRAGEPVIARVASAASAPPAAGGPRSTAAIVAAAGGVRAAAVAAAG
jgi:glutamate synthase domain-containing protein 1